MVLTSYNHGCCRKRLKAFSDRVIHGITAGGLLVMPAFEATPRTSTAQGSFITHIEKRDGRRVPFDASKITAALLKAGKATGEFGEDTARQLTMRVLGLYQQMDKPETPTVEAIQDVVEAKRPGSFLHRVEQFLLRGTVQHLRD